MAEDEYYNMILEETGFVWLMWGMEHELFLLYKVCMVWIISTRDVMGKKRFTVNLIDLQQWFG